MPIRSQVQSYRATGIGEERMNTALRGISPTFNCKHDYITIVYIIKKD